MMNMPRNFTVKKDKICVLTTIVINLLYQNLAAFNLKKAERDEVSIVVLFLSLPVNLVCYAILLSEKPRKITLII